MVALNSFFGCEESLLKRVIFLTYRTHFPAISLFTILGIMLLFKMDRKFLFLSAWPTTLSILIFNGITWSFPRHAIITLPGFVLISALPVAKVLEECKRHKEHVRFYYKKCF